MKLPTAGLITLKEDKLLLAYSNNKKAWYLPGGKIDRNETAVEAIIREIKEELSIKLDSEKLSYYCHVTAPAYGEAIGIIMEQECFLYNLENYNIEASHEIGAVKYFSYEDYLKEPIQVCGVITVYKRLLKDNIIKTKDIKNSNSPFSSIKDEPSHQKIVQIK